jgi:uncharacterized secreted protein with C-terminal beta-propeller domain
MSTRRALIGWGGAILCAVALAFGPLGCSSSAGELPAEAAGSAGAAGIAGGGLGGSIGAGGAGGSVRGGGAGTVDIAGSISAFESDDPSRAAANDVINATMVPDIAGGTGGAAYVSAGDSSKEAERAIVEADIIQVVGDTLYALSEYGGLSVIDIANPDDLKMLGRHVIRANPFEMYVKSGVAYAMYSSFPRYEYDSVSGYYTYVVSSRVVAVDVRDPAALNEIGTFDLPGEISDSRMVGDIMYVVSYENGNCWRCVQNQPRTTVTSIAAADPAAIRQVDQLTFDDQKGSYSWYKRSISVTTQRLYVSGMVYDNTWGTDTGHSTIQVVDIADPSGKLVAGATVPVNGQIENRWEMDEFEGVLRVISQSGSTWSNGPAPVVETFRVQSAQVLQPLGKLPLTLPTKENLKSVRFDGPRGYAVTFVQKDPLFTIDLSDPAAPKQAGQVEMPGYLYYMEPRGDRLVALGFDSGNATGGLTVSIFDVATLATPTLLSRANFGGSWNTTPEDQDRIHKAFRLFDAEGLIVMPFSGWTYQRTDAGVYTCSTYLSGVQLLDFTRDTVTTRGIVPLRGQARRALLHKGRLLAVSDDQVASFDIANRDAPVRTDVLALANVADKTVRMGDYLVELGTDWWTSEPQITVVPIAAGAQAIPVATFELGETLNTSKDACMSRYWSSFSNSAQLFVNGNLVYVVYDAGFAGTGAKGRMGFAVIDLTDPLSPRLAGSSVLEIAQPAPTMTSGPYSYYYGSYGIGIGYYYNPTGVWQSGARVVRVGSTIVLEEISPRQSEIPDQYGLVVTTSQATLHAVDLSDPANIRLVSSHAITEGASSSGMFVDGSNVFTSHQEEIGKADTGTPGRARFFVDRVDYANPAAPARTKINVPGSLFGVDKGGARVVTIDYRRTIQQLTTTNNAYSVCQTTGITGAFVDYWVQYPLKLAPEGATPMYDYTQPPACVHVFRTFRLLDIDPAGAKLLDSFEPFGERVGGVSMGADRLFFIRNKYVSASVSGTNRSYYQVSVDTLSGIRAGAFTMGAPIVTTGDSVTTQPDGTLVGIVSTWSPPTGVRVYDTADPAKPRLALDMGLPSSGGSYYYSTNVTLDDKYAVVSMGKYGAQALPLR